MYVIYEHNILAPSEGMTTQCIYSYVYVYVFIYMYMYMLDDSGITSGPTQSLNVHLVCRPGKSGLPKIVLLGE